MPRLPGPASQCLGLDTLSPREKRARFGVGLGCPSFGGQRTVRSSSRRLLARLVTNGRSSLAGHWLIPALQAWRESLPLRGFRVWQGRPIPVSPGQFSGEFDMSEVSTSTRPAARQPSLSLARLVVQRSARLPAQLGSPNHSIKGTSRKRAAPYVER
jgi:hypothetical protein